MNESLPEWKVRHRVVGDGDHPPVQSVLVFEILVELLEPQISVPNAAGVEVQAHSDDRFVVRAVETRATL